MKKTININLKISKSDCEGSFLNHHKRMKKYIISNEEWNTLTYNNDESNYWNDEVRAFLIKTLHLHYDMKYTDGMDDE